jgi:hypothetical protein
MRIMRYRVADPSRPHPLDAVMDLRQSEASVGLREAVCDLALRLPYRQSAEVIGSHTGQELSHQSCWAMLQAEGAKVRTEEGELVEAIFELGQAPQDLDEHFAFAVLEADGTFLRAQGEGQDRFEVKTGVAYVGKTFAGGRRHRRWALRGKQVHATTADADAFGMGFAAAGFTQLGLHQIPHVLAAHDGLDAYGATFAGWFPHAIHQVDHFHVAKRLWEACGHDPPAFRRLYRQALGKPHRLASELRRGMHPVRPDVAAELATYLEHVGADLRGIDKIPTRLRQARMHVVGTGVVEKHQDLVVGRRMKRRGMRWSMRGADHLLALQARRYSGRWDEIWERRAA